MKKIKLLFLAAIAFAGVNANAQTVDEIIEKNTEALGGAEKLNSLKTVRMSGGMNVQGADIALTITKSHLVGFRLDIEAGGTSNYQVATPKEGWVYMPAMGMADPVKMEEDQLKSSTSQMDLQGSLYNYKEKGTTVDLSGTEKVDGNEAHKLTLKYKNGKTVTYFIDKKTNLLVKSSGKSNVQGQEMEVETTFADYRKNADGYMFPYAVTNMQGTINFEKIETNIAVDDKIFSK